MTHFFLFFFSNLFVLLFSLYLPYKIEFKDTCSCMFELLIMILMLPGKMVNLCFPLVSVLNYTFLYFLSFGKTNQSNVVLRRCIFIHYSNYLTEKGFKIWTYSITNGLLIQYKKTDKKAFPNIIKASGKEAKIQNKKGMGEAGLFYVFASIFVY